VRALFPQLIEQLARASNGVSAVGYCSLKPECDAARRPSRSAEVRLLTCLGGFVAGITHDLEAKAIKRFPKQNDIRTFAYHV
jgi:hypothetical protein